MVGGIYIYIYIERERERGYEMRILRHDFQQNMVFLDIKSNIVDTIK